MSPAPNAQAPSLVNVNGSILRADEAQVSILDHGLLYGDGLFETMRVSRGRVFRLEVHLSRLRECAARLELPLLWADTELADALAATIQANGITDGAVRLTVTRGAGPPVPDPEVCEEPTLFITARAWTPPGEAEWARGKSACLAGRHPKLWVPGIKSLCYLPFQQARTAARRRGFDEGLLADEGFLVEGATTNLFVVREGVVVTPPLERGCLPGIARALVLEIVGSLGLPAREADVSPRDLETCEEAFLTSSLLGVAPLVRFEERALGVGAMTRRLHAAYEALLAETSG